MTSTSPSSASCRPTVGFPNADLARRIGLAPAATHARLRRLERDGVIARYVALLDTEATGFDLLCFVSVGLRVDDRAEIDRFRDASRRCPRS